MKECKKSSKLQGVSGQEGSKLQEPRGENDCGFGGTADAWYTRSDKHKTIWPSQKRVTIEEMDGKEEI